MYTIILENQMNKTNEFWSYLLNQLKTYTIAIDIETSTSNNLITQEFIDISLIYMNVLFFNAVNNCNEKNHCPTELLTKYFLL